MVSTSSAVAKKRVVCPVCQRRGWGDSMGEIRYLEDSPEQWMWYQKPKHNVHGAGFARTDDPSNPRGAVFKDGFYKKSEWSVKTPADGALKLRCDDGHRLTILEPETMTDLLRKADEVGRAWIAIPE